LIAAIQDLENGAPRALDFEISDHHHSRDSTIEVKRSQPVSNDPAADTHPRTARDDPQDSREVSPRDFGELRHYLGADLYRYHGSCGWSEFLHSVFREPGYQFTFWMRLCRFLHSRRWSRMGPYWFSRLMFHRYRFKYGLHIDFSAIIGPGLYICHVGGIVVNRRCVIGRNCNLSHEVTLGSRSRGPLAGCPTIGDDVYIAPGAKVIGAIRVGDRVAIGANCVVVKDVPDDGVVVGIPGRVISDKGSAGLVNQTGWS
jgi:serine O-acetyltransferase